MHADVQAVERAGLHLVRVIDKNDGFLPGNRGQEAVLIAHQALDRPGGQPSELLDVKFAGFVPVGLDAEDNEGHFKTVPEGIQNRGHHRRDR